MILGLGGRLMGDVQALPPPDPQGRFVTWLLVRNYLPGGAPNAAALSALLASPAVYQAHAQEIAGVVRSRNYNGVLVDYRGLTPDQQAAFLDFLAHLRRALHEQGKILAVMAPLPLPGENGRFHTGGYDWNRLGRLADVLYVEAPDDPNAFVPGGLVEQSLRWLIGRVNRYQLQLVGPSRGIDLGPSGARSVAFEEALAHLAHLENTGPLTVTPGITLTLEPGATARDLEFLAEAGVYRYLYVDPEGQPHTVWMPTIGLLDRQLALVRTYRLRGLTLRGLLEGGTAPGTVEAMQAYRQRGEVPPPPTLEWVWRITGPDGRIVAEIPRPLADGQAQWAAPESAEGPFRIALLLRTHMGSNPRGRPRASLPAPPRRPPRRRRASPGPRGRPARRRRRAPARRRAPRPPRVRGPSAVALSWAATWTASPGRI
jgi:hypothetical protein